MVGITVGRQEIGVRRVRYKNLPPVGCDAASSSSPAGCGIEAIAEDFDAYPDFGFESIDYYDYIVTDTEKLTRETPYLTAYWEEGTWRLEKPAVATAPTSVRFCIVRSVSGNLIWVQPLTQSSTGSLLDDGPPIPTTPQYGFSASWYQPLADKSVYTSMVYVDGAWRTMLAVPWYLLTPTGSYPSGGCTPR